MNEPKRGSVRVMTWNIHGALGRNPRFDLVRVVELIRRWDPDLIALQEVDSRRAFAAGTNPFEFLPGAIGVFGIGAKTIVTEDGEYGQMLVSRWPFRHHVERDISYPEREPRRAICADVETPGGLVRVIATHMGLSLRERRDQARALIDLADGGEPIVIAGDFNDWFWPGSVRGLLSQQFRGRTRFRTFPSLFPMLGLDCIYCRPAGALVASFVDREARTLSDHLPVIADMAF